MRLAIFGASGRTGAELVRAALGRGFEVRAVVRDVTKMRGLFPLSSALHGPPALEIVELTDLTDEARVRDALTACAAVLCALGARPSCRTIRLLERAVLQLIDAMRFHGIPRLIVLSAMFSRPSRDYPFLLEWLYKPLVIGRNMEDFCRMENLLAADCQDINFTVVKPARLTDGAALTQTVRATEGDFVRGGEQHPIPRANVANFMLDCLKIPDWDRKLVSIAM